jgi:hypothetical protein
MTVKPSKDGERIKPCPSRGAVALSLDKSAAEEREFCVSGTPRRSALRNVA